MDIVDRLTDGVVWHAQDIAPTGQVNIGETEIVMKAAAEEIMKLRKERDEAKRRAEQLEAFVRHRVQCELLKKNGGYHGRRVYLEAQRVLSGDDIT